MELLSAPRLPAGLEELAHSGRGLRNQAVVLAKLAVAEAGQSPAGKCIPFPTPRTLSDHRPKFELAEAVSAVLAMIHHPAQSAYPLLPLHNHLSRVELGLRYNPWMTECTVFSAEVAASRCHPEPQLRQLLRPVTNTCGR